MGEEWAGTRDRAAKSGKRRQYAARFFGEGLGQLLLCG